MTGSSFHFQRRSPQSGAALLITLALLVLLVALALAFFSRVNNSSRATVVASSQTEVNLLTKSALDAVIGDLRTEMVSGSVVNARQNYIWMKPNTDAAWSPSRQVKNTVLSDSKFQNLVKQSVTSLPLFPNAAPYDTNIRPTIKGASATNTSQQSYDKHVFTPTRWDLPALTLGSFSATQAPDWIYMSREGIPESQAFNDAWKDPKSLSAVLGRFAFNVYDISGLLDINIAGFPSSNANRAADKGGLPWSNLESNVDVLGTNIPLVSPGQAVVSWRNKGSLTNFENFVSNYGLEKGFMEHAYGDRHFDTRGDLIRYATRSGSPINPKVLPFLTTFSRTVNAPSWIPTTPTGSTINYASLADQTSATNRNISGVRVLAPFDRRNTTGVTEKAIVGEPLIKRRFPLSAIGYFAQFEAAPNNEDLKKQIQKYFGLSRNNTSDPWTYNLLNGKIRTLNQVAQENREPDFFELLKAGILQGGLGSNNSGQSLATNFEADRSVDRQVLQIGANIIDQYDTDAYPTVITTLALADDAGRYEGDIYGIENHPFISAMFQVPFRRHDLDSSDSLNKKGDPRNPEDKYNPHPWINVFLQFQIWNPHLNAANGPGGEYRIIAKAGRTKVNLVKNTVPPDVAAADELLLADSAIYFSIGNGSNLLYASEPLLLNADRVDKNQTPGQNLYTNSNAKLAGIFQGAVDGSHNLDGDATALNSIGPNSNDYKQLSVTILDGARYQLQWKPPAGEWITIEELGPMSGDVASGIGAPNGNLYFDMPGIYTNPAHVDTNYLFSDPRTRRFGVHGRPQDVENTEADQSLRPVSNTYGKVAGASFNASTLWGSSVPGYAPAELAENNSSSSVSYYRGTDNINRLADTTKSQNVFSNASIGRPFMLNRPFRSVGEMAYAFRDEPWKSLDFFTDKSADSALLDLFSVNEAPVQAGVININKADTGVIESVITGALNDPSISSTAVIDANALATALRQALGPINSQTRILKNRADLPNLIAASNFPGLDRKRQRESVARAFGDTLNLRTWNLLIDLVVQSGKIRRSGTGLGDFAMTAERRVWAQVAIDRISGEIVDIQVETVNE